ncbi:MAG: aminomethyltransferase family protein, partial [Pseudomonadota bacterium]
SDGVEVENISDRRTGFQIAGPKARDLLARITTADVGAMRFRDVWQIPVGPVQCIVQRVSYTGDLGFEIYCDTMEQRALWDVLWQAGAAFDLTPFGMRAMMSLRLDRFFGSWLNEFSPDYTAGETGMDRFIHFGKNTDFIGRAAAEEERASGAKRQLVALSVGAKDADVQGYEPVWINGQVEGFCTSGGYSHHTDTSVALALVARDRVVDGLQAEIEVLGDLLSAKLMTQSLFDPAGERMQN